MYFINNINPKTPPGRNKLNPLSKIPNLVNPSIRSGINLQYIHGTAANNGQTISALIAGFTSQGIRTVYGLG
jgi:hypothetical protein